MVEKVELKVKKEDESGVGNIKNLIKEIDRTGERNMYGRFERQRKTKREMDDNLEQMAIDHPRVTIAKFDSKKYVRGLEEGEEPFPVSPKIGPYLL